MKRADSVLVAFFCLGRVEREKQHQGASLNRDNCGECLPFFYFSLRGRCPFSFLCDSKNQPRKNNFEKTTPNRTNKNKTTCPNYPLTQKALWRSPLMTFPPQLPPLTSICMTAEEGSCSLSQLTISLVKVSAKG